MTGVQTCALPILFPRCFPVTILDRCFLMATDKTQGLPHVAAATAAEIAAAALAPFVRKRLASLLAYRDWFSWL